MPEPATPATHATLHELATARRGRVRPRRRARRGADRHRIVKFALIEAGIVAAVLRDTVSATVRQRSVGIEVRPGRDHPSPRHQPEGRLRADNAEELGRDSIGAGRDQHAGLSWDRAFGQDADEAAIAFELAADDHPVCDDDG